ncbi:MAG TPA: DUF4124 domain-containing protein, partial [Burkholderiaceae bacterium]|nr:DUF4124 domain-containing protein [Burkholderiaceae bacterium]
MKSTYLKQIAMLLATCCVAASAFAQYVWLDDHGVKQFSDVAPPSNIPPNRILKQPHGGAPAPQADTTSADKPGDAAADSAKTPMTTAEKEADYKKRKQEQADKDKKAADEAKRKELAEKNCALSKTYLEQLKNGTRITGSDANGERTYMSDDERAKEAAKTQETVDT